MLSFAITERKIPFFIIHELAITHFVGVLGTNFSIAYGTWDPNRESEIALFKQQGKGFTKQTEYIGALIPRPRWFLIHLWKCIGSIGKLHF